jgi:excisionase family DNA binding protein
MKSRIEVDTLAMSKSETQYRSEAVHASAVVDAITPREAAKILQVSRPSVMRLIKMGFLCPRKVASRNKLSRADVLAYQAAHALEQRKALANLTALSDEYDF